jgi:hypothetical protein
MISINALNEAHDQIYEALNNGAASAVLQRLITPNSVLKTIQVAAPAEGGTAFAYSLISGTPTVPYLFTIEDLNCFNDGIQISFHADQLLASGVAVPNTAITLNILDSNGNQLWSFTGDLNPAAVDDYGNSTFLPAVIAAQTDSFNVTVASGASIGVTTDAYGRDANGNDQYDTSPTQIYFTEGGYAYATTDYANACTALQRTSLDFGYIITGGSQSPALIAELVQLSYNTNTQLRIDVPGSLTPAAAETFVAQLDLDTHYASTYWAPLRANDPLGINGPVVLGTAGYQVALACARNAQQNTKGFAPKNYPIAGKAWPLNRTGITQIYDPLQSELSDLAAAKINPVLYQTYNGGGLYVYTDSLTTAVTQVSLRKLVSVSEMATTIDQWVVLAGKEFLQLPMTVAIKKMNDFLKTTFTGAQASGWIVPSAAMNGLAYQYQVVPNSVNPADQMDVTYTVRYDGVARQITVTQTLSK